MLELIVLLAASVMAVTWRYRLMRLSTVKTPLTTFGPTPTDLSSAEHKAVLVECVRQQRWAFALVWFAVAVSMSLSLVLLSRAVPLRLWAAKDISAALGVFGDVSVAASAFRLYRLSGEQMRKILELLVSGTPSQSKA